MPQRTIFHANEEDATLGGRISMAREATGLSVADVVKRLGVRANKLVALAGILNVSPPYLLSGLGKQPPQSALP